MRRFTGLEICGVAALAAALLSTGCGAGGGSSHASNGGQFGGNVQHRVDLSWNASTPVASGGPIMGYNVYRSLQQNGPFMVLNPTPLTGLSFVDSNVLAGHTYWYVVTSIDSNNIESAFSTPAMAAVPTP